MLYVTVILSWPPQRSNEIKLQLLFMNAIKQNIFIKIK